MVCILVVNVVLFFLGSTGCTCMIMNKVLYIANCGDSKAMMSSGGELVELTIDQKPEDPIEQER